MMVKVDLEKKNQETRIQVYEISLQARSYFFKRRGEISYFTLTKIHISH